MKQILFYAFVCSALFACNQSSTPDKVSVTKQDSVMPSISSAMNQTVAATAVGTSDSMMIDTTTEDSWRIAGFTDPAGFKKFFNQYKKWVADDNIDSITAHIQFPLRNCRSAVIFKKSYTSYFNDEVKKSVANQNSDKFFANYNGAMTGNGELWFSEIKGKYFVIAINNKM